MNAKYEPCSICERHMNGVVCDEGNCPVAVMKAENERLQAENEEQDQAIINALHRVGQIRAEAIKEFAEKIKEMLEWTTEPLDEYDIDSLVKEMTEGRHAETD